jgi:hypothetical protein
VAWYFHYSILQLVWRDIFIIQYYNWCGVIFSLFNVTTGVAWYFHYSILELVWRGVFIIQYYNWCGWYFHYSILQLVWRGIFIIQYYNWCGVVFSLLNITTGVAWYCHYFHFIIIEII